MIRHSVVAILAIVAVATPALAQEPKVTVGAVFGRTLGDGVIGRASRAPDGHYYNRLDPKDAFSWDLNVGYLATPRVEVGFVFGRQRSTLEAGGTSVLDLGDLTVSTYHGYFAYNFGGSNAQISPYVLGGLGVTSFSSVTTTVGGGSHTLSGGSRLSTTWGGGVKVSLNPKVGVQMGIRWTPAYIKSDAPGWWCDAWWGCALAGHAQYANLFESSCGVTFRF